MEMDRNTVFCSKNHAERHGSDVFILNALDPEDYGSVDWKSQRQDLLFLGYAKRPEKNLTTCLRLARENGRKLAIVGGKFKWYRWRPWARYHGFLGGIEKNQVLNNSVALLFPVLWHEPFGIALIEALYFGNPVIGTVYGSLPEIVHPQVGFLSTRYSELLEALDDVERWNRRGCHEYVMERFHIKRMTDEYLQLYHRILDGELLQVNPPRNPGNFDSRMLLPLEN
jgi:glycosyltransferase involved in cell wall biosynthesis